jgi:type IV secretory pathway TrbF-like protein
VCSAILQVNASLGDWRDAAAAYQAAADAWGDTSQQQQQQARALLGCGVALDRAVSSGTVYQNAASIPCRCVIKVALLMHVEGHTCPSRCKL